jgi:hypothetical protein
MIVGVAASAMTILPLRQVLVPADIGTLTITDLLLGVEVLFSVFGAVVPYF